MIWSGPEEFFAMGGYGLYVWGSVVVVAIALVIEVSLVRQRRRALFVQFSRNGNTHDETQA